MAAEGLAAIIARIKADATLGPLGGPWLDSAKPDAAFPWVVVSDSGGTPLVGFDSSELERHDFTFSVFGTDQDAIRTYLAAVKALFYKVRFSSGSSALVGVPKTAPTVRQAGQKNGTPVYRGTVSYRFQVQP